MIQEEVYCYHCMRTFYLNGYRLREAKTVSCLFCGKRIDKKKSKEFEGKEQMDCSNG